MTIASQIGDVESAINLFGSTLNLKVLKTSAIVPAITNVNVSNLVDGATVIALGRDSDGDGGGDIFRYSASTSVPVNGVTVFTPTAGIGRLIRNGQTSIGFTRPVRAAYAGAYPVPGLDNRNALFRLRDFLAVQIFLPEGIFDAGKYEYSESPNWNISRLKLKPQGMVTFKNTGTGISFIIKDLTFVGLYGLDIGPFHIEGGPTSDDGVGIQSVHHSDINFNVHGCGPTKAGMRVNFSVCNVYTIIVSVNEGGWVPGAKPYYGLYMDSGIDGGGVLGEATQNKVYPVIEGTPYGIYLQQAVGNEIKDGTVEGCWIEGIHGTNLSFSNRIVAVDMEANYSRNSDGSPAAINTALDINMEGDSTEIISSRTMTGVTIGAYAKNCKINGGIHQLVTTGLNTSNTLLQNFETNRFSDVSSTGLNDLSGGRVVIENVIDVRTGKLLQGNTTPYNVTPTGTGFSFTNTTNKKQQVVVGGGVVTAITLHRGAVTVDIGQVAGPVVLNPDDQLVFTYSMAPTITVFPL